MAYSFKPDETIHNGVKRIVTEELDSAAGQLEGHGQSDRDEAIHEARKSVKKIRGVLRLVRPELGSVYTLENQRFRELGHRLSEFRDAGAMLETFDQLDQLYRETWGRQHNMASIRGRLLEAKAGHESEAGIAAVLSAVSGELNAASSKVKEWPLDADGFEAIAPGLELTYRGGRRAMTRAVRDPSPENYHDWRKRVKDHWYHVRLIGNVCGGALSFYQRSLKDLETCLGDDHNLTVLRERISVEPTAYGSPSDTSFFLDTVANHRSTLRAAAVSQGQDVYDDQPKVFVRQLRSLWRAWSKDRARTNCALAATG